MSDYEFQIQQTDGEWRTLFRDQRGFCRGYFFCYREAPGPRLAARVVDPKGKVIDETPARTEVGIGMVSGWPTAEQYEAAAAAAMERARQIREREARTREREESRRNRG